jgi:hypothetical protein
MPAMQARRKDEWTAQEHIQALRHLHTTPADLKSLVELMQELIAEDLDRRAEEVKLGCPGVPLGSIKNDLKRNQCACAYALRLCSQ